MAYIEQAPGGELTNPDGSEELPVTNRVTDYFIKIQNLIARRLRETGGPTTLAMGAVTDGQLLSRSGTTIAGVTSTALSVALPVGFLFGLTLSNNGSDATNDIDIAAGRARDIDDSENMILSSLLTKRLDASWSVGSGNGGLDTGSIADTTYHIFLIKRTDTGVVDALFSTSATSPTMPTNYTKKRRIGSIRRISAAIRGFVQDGDLFMWKTPINDVNATNPGTSAVTRTLTLPTGIRVEVIFSVHGYTSGTLAADYPGAIYISDLNADDLAPVDSSGFTTWAYLPTISAGAGGMGSAMTNTSAQVRSRIQQSTANTVLKINTHGWRDTRGRLA